MKLLLVASLGAVSLVVGAGSLEIGGFVTDLEDVHEIGATADSCIDVRSVTVPLTLEPERDRDEAPERVGPPHGERQERAPIDGVP